MASVLASREIRAATQFYIGVALVCAQNRLMSPSSLQFPRGNKYLREGRTLRTSHDRDCVNVSTPAKKPRFRCRDSQRWATQRDTLGNAEGQAGSSHKRYMEALLSVSLRKKISSARTRRKKFSALARVGRSARMQCRSVSSVFSARPLLM